MLFRSGSAFKLTPCFARNSPASAVIKIRICCNLMNKDFHDIIEYNEHPAMVYGARVSRMILDQVLACEGRLSLS